MTAPLIYVAGLLVAAALVGVGVTLLVAVRKLHRELDRVAGRIYYMERPVQEAAREVEAK